MKKKIVIGVIPIGLMLVLSFSGCLFSPEPEKQSLSDELNIFNWDDYFGETTLADFEKQFGVKINLYTFEDESFMISSLETNPTLYDVIITSGSYVNELIQTKSLAKLNKDNIPNLKNIAPKFLDQYYDPGNIYSIPYLWGTTGIAVNTSAVTEEVTSWSILWNNNYTGRISMLNSKEEVIAVALKYLGYSVNPENISQLKEAEELLLQQKSLLTGYEDPMSIRNKLISGAVVLAHCYSGDAMFVAGINENVSYVIPEDGVPLWIDNVVIPVDSPHKYTAEVFINYLLEPEVSANITNYQWYANPNIAAEEFIDPEILEDQCVYPPQVVLDRCESFRVLDSDLLSEMNRIWAELQS